MIVLAFPVLIVVNPELMPQTVLITGIPTIALNIVRNWGEADYREVGWLAAGRVPGLLAGTLLVVAVDRSYLALAGGFVVLAAVALSLWAPKVQRTTSNLFAAGTISALFGTAIGIGGPPLGLLYQHETGGRLRGTVSLLMVTGSPLSILLLSMAGEFSQTDLRTGLALTPFTIAGNLSAPRFIPWFDERVRVVVLVVCAFAATVAMARVAMTL